MGRAAKLNAILEKIRFSIKNVLSQKKSFREKKSDHFIQGKDKHQLVLKKQRKQIQSLKRDIKRQKSILQENLQRLKILGDQTSAFRSDRDTFKRERDAFARERDTLRRERDVLRRNTDSLTNETNLLSNLFSSSLSTLLLDQQSLRLLVDCARECAVNANFSRLKTSLQNECSWTIDNSDSQISIDSSKLILGVINFHRGLDKGSLLYFESIVDQSLLPKFAFLEYYRTVFKYTEILKSGLSPRELLRSIDETYLSCEKNAFSLVAAINSCGEIPVEERVNTSQVIFNKFLSLLGENDQHISWSKKFLNESKLVTNSCFKSSDNNDKLLNVGIMDYKTVDLDFCSSNLGDYVQTMVSALAWNQALGINFVPSTKIGDALNVVLETAKTSNRASVRNLNPVIINRDSSHYNCDYPPNTWFICNGWYHHSPFKTDLEFGFPENINPIFISFHLNKSTQLRHEMISYLKSHQPIGCRDWTTVHMLKSKGVDAFFSGCLTMTIGDLFSNITRTINIKNIACVEADPDLNDDATKVCNYVQAKYDVKQVPISDAIVDAYNMLKQYLQFDKIYTSRLHCYLPCTSMGLKAIFKPKNRSDQRYSGLYPLSPEEFQNLRSKLRNKLNSAILFIEKTRPSKKDFLSFWASLWTEEVKQADLYHQEGKNIELLDADIDVAASLKELQETRISSLIAFDPNHVNIAFGFDSNLLEQFEVTIKSILLNTKSKLSMYILGRDLPNEWINQIILKYPQIHFCFYDMSTINYGKKISTLKHITMSTMDRIFLSALLPIDKVIYLDVDVIVRFDILELWQTDIGENMLAGVQSINEEWRDVMSIVLRASLRLDPATANNLRRYCYSKFPNSLGTNFNAGVLVMNLEQMKSISFVDIALSLIVHYGLNDQDVLALIANGNVYSLSGDYNFVPDQSFQSNPKVVHWAGLRKPWDVNIYAPYQKEYFYYKNITLDG